MNWYANRPGRATRQVAADLFVLAWTVLWVLVGRWVDGTIRALAEPARETARRAEETARAIRDAAGQAGGVPGIGDGLRRPLDQAAGSVDGIVTAAEQQVVLIETVATVMGIVCFVIPFAVVVAVWLPRRLRFARTSRAATGLLDTEAGVDLLALRAMATVPLPALLTISPDPVRAWRDGDLEVITALADHEIARLGLRRRPIVDPGPADAGRSSSPDDAGGGQPSTE